RVCLVGLRIRGPPGPRAGPRLAPRPASSGCLPHDGWPGPAADRGPPSWKRFLELEFAVFAEIRRSNSIRMTKSQPTTARRLVLLLFDPARPLFASILAACWGSSSAMIAGRLAVAAIVVLPSGAGDGVVVSVPGTGGARVQSE